MKFSKNVFLLFSLLFSTLCYAHEKHSKNFTDISSISVLPFSESVLPANLIDHRGNDFTLIDHAGRIVLVNFIFTQCTDVCPMQTVELAKINQLIKEDPLGAYVDFVSITIDTENDTPEVLSNFAKSLNVDSPNWRFATGEPETIREMVKTLWVGVQPQKDGSYDHRTMLYLVGPDGNLLQRYQADPLKPKRIVRELQDLYKLYWPS